ncbi:MAG TPA: hypothetical protein VK068_02290, partial [Jeotgalicoccus sp.]|nr:hypothetical protein [Jeotgalicoccus sp.]
LVSLSLLFTMFLSPISQSHAAQSQEINSNQNLHNENVEPQAAGVLIFFAGIAVGYIIDGVVIYKTGYSSSYWIAQGLNGIREALSNLPKIANGSFVIVQQNGNLEICNESGYCAISTKNPDYK